MRKKKHPEHVNHERWLVSYADFITLLFAFFTTLYAISNVDQQKAGKLQFSMMTAFHIAFFPNESAVYGGNAMESMVTTPEQLMRQQTSTKSEELKAVAKALEKATDGEKEASGKIFVGLREGNIIISLAQAAFFDSGQAEVRADARHLLSKVFETIRKHRADFEIVVEGHADNIPMSKGRYASNWELSAARAMSVMRLLLTEGVVDPRRLSLAGFGEHRPVASNTTPQGRSRNRRVDLVLKPYILAEPPKTQAAADPPKLSSESTIDAPVSKSGSAQDVHARSQNSGVGHE